MPTYPSLPEPSRNWPSRGGAMTEEAYQKCPTIQEIVLISQFAQYVEIWQRDEQDGTRWHYRHYSPDEVVDLHSIAAHIAISEIYRGLNFAELNEEDE